MCTFAGSNLRISIVLLLNLPATGEQIHSRASIPVLNLEQEQTNIQKPKRCCDAEFLQEYWQLQLEESSRTLVSIITPGRFFTPTRVPRRTTNATVHMQTQFTKSNPNNCNLTSPHRLATFRYTQNHLAIFLQWFHFYFDYISPINSNCIRQNANFSPTLAAGDNVPASKTLSKFTADDFMGFWMQMPTIQAKLQQLLCSVECMFNSTTKFSAFAKPLSQLMERVIKRVVVCITYADTGWSNIKQTAFDRCRAAL